MGLVLVTAPTIEPVTVAEAKEHCRISGTDEDTYVATLIAAARRVCETKAKQDFINRTWRLEMEYFQQNNDGGICIPRPPLSSVTHVKYYDTANTLQTVSSSNYQVNAGAFVGEVCPIASYVWPAVYPERFDAVQVTFVSGYGATASTVPETFRLAIMMLAAHFYEHRETVSDMQAYKVPMAIDSLIAAEGRVEVY